MYKLKASKKRYEFFIDATKVRDFLGYTDDEILQIPIEDDLDLKLLELAAVMKHLRVDKTWVRTPNSGLQNKSPFDKIKSGGLTELTDLLISVANGDFHG